MPKGTTTSGQTLSSPPRGHDLHVPQPFLGSEALFPDPIPAHVSSPETPQPWEEVQVGSAVEEPAGIAHVSYSVSSPLQSSTSHLTTYFQTGACAEESPAIDLFGPLVCFYTS
jgi:hypothetical protein